MSKNMLYFTPQMTTFWVDVHFIHVLFPHSLNNEYLSSYISILLHLVSYFNAIRVKNAVTKDIIDT